MSDFWKGKRVLVVGCSGLIGAPLCKMLLEAGAVVEGFDLDPVGILPKWGVDIPVFVRDIRQPQVIPGYTDVVFHLAAVSGVEESRANGLRTWEVNVQGTWNALEACRQVKGLQAVVVASSNHVYGKQERLPVFESAPLRQLDTYSASKIAADYIARAYAHNYGLPVSVVRNTNCYGPYDPHHDHIIPATILSCLRGERPVIKSDGKRKKGYLYVLDVVDAYLAVAMWTAGHGHGEVFNVASQPVSVLELVRTIMRACHVEGKPTIQGQPNDQTDEWLDDWFIRKSTGWLPRRKLGVGLIITINAFRQEAKEAISTRS